WLTQPHYVDEVSMDRLSPRTLGNRWPIALMLFAVLVTSCGPSGGASGPLPGAARPTAGPAGSAATSPVSGGSGGSAGISACPPSGSATSLTGAGSTFAAPLYSRWAADYARLCNVQINYQA